MARSLGRRCSVPCPLRRLWAHAHELDLFVPYPKLLCCLESRSSSRAVEARQGALDEGRRASAEAQLQAALTSEIGDGDLLRAWPSLSVREKRRLMHGLLDRVVVQRADRGGRHARPISDRTQII